MLFFPLWVGDQAWALELNGPLVAHPAELILFTALHEKQLESCRARAAPVSAHYRGDLVVTVKKVSEIEPHKQ